jgi:two-component system sensor histidine kinase DctS
MAIFQIALIAAFALLAWFGNGHLSMDICILALSAIAVWSVWRVHRMFYRMFVLDNEFQQSLLFRRALDLASIGGLRVRDHTGRILYVNPAFCRMTGYAAHELIGAVPPDIPYWDNEQTARRAQECLDRALNDISIPNDVELTMRRKNGERFEVLVVESPFIDENGVHLGWLGAFIDITGQKHLRRQRERLQTIARLTTMGEMASSLAHELNQPLTAISAYTGGLLTQINTHKLDVAELREVLTRIERHSQRAASIIGRIHAFVRRNDPHFAPIDLNALIREIALLIDIDAQKNQVNIICELDPDLPEVIADVQLIEQIIVNLARNGIDAMVDTPLGERELRLSTHVQDRAVSIQIGDCGCGIAPETIRHLFEPFFTTKPEGMGIGLNICRSIAELHNGQLSFSPNPQGGTTFTLTLHADNYA